MTMHSFSRYRSRSRPHRNLLAVPAIQARQLNLWDKIIVELFR